MLVPTVPAALPARTDVGADSTDLENVSIDHHGDLGGPGPVPHQRRHPRRGDALHHGTRVSARTGRRAASGIGIPLLVEDTAQSALLRQLVQSAVVLLLRPLPEWSSDVPGTCYLVAKDASVQPLNRHKGGTLERWNIAGDVVAAPAAGVVVPIISYGDVQPAWTTYGQLQDTMQAKTYLDVQRDPFGAGNEAAMMRAAEV
mgnify:CR=1 FL=1